MPVTQPRRPRLPRRALVVALVTGLSALALLLGGGRAGTMEVEEAAASVVARNPFTEIERPRAGDERFSGWVTELRAAGPYTYASIDVGPPTKARTAERTEARRLRWVVMLRAGAIARGDRVVVKSFGTQTNFRSRRLGMTFDELVFGVVRPDREGEEASR